MLLFSVGGFSGDFRDLCDLKAGKSSESPKSPEGEKIKKYYNNY